MHDRYTYVNMIGDVVKYLLAGDASHRAGHGSSKTWLALVVKPQSTLAKAIRENTKVRPLVVSALTPSLEGQARGRQSTEVLEQGLCCAIVEDDGFDSW